jgi:hypothetical protein
MDDSWKKSTCTEADLQALVDEGLLQPREIVQWRPTERDVRPFEHTKEIVLFQHFIEHGLGLPTSNFFCGLLFHYGIELHHLNPNSILHIAIFVHFCEAFLGLEPHFNLFCYLFHLKPQPSEQNIAEVGGAGLQLRQGMDKKYLEFKFPTSLSSWRERWFYIGNHKPSLPERTTEKLKIAREWREMPYQADMDKIYELLVKIMEHNIVGVTGASVVYSWMGRRIQPLQKQT